MASNPTPLAEDRSLFFAPLTLRNCLLNWLVPGLGYVLVRRYKEAAIMAACLYAALFFGILQGGDLFPLFTKAEGWLRMAGGICQLGLGLPYLIAKAFMSRGTPLSLTYDYGTIYFLVGGMINWLAVFDIFDIAVKRK